MPKLIILDWQCLAKTLSHSIRSGAVPCTFPTEPEEISHRVMKRLFCLRADHPDDTIVIANDKKKYWRETYMIQWYLERELEPVLYKGNRLKQDWLFATSPEDMNKLYDQLLEDGAKSIGAVVVQDTGLEADDIFGILAKTYPGEVVGITTDTDWGSLIDERVKVKELSTGDFMPVKDIRLKMIGGDPGDNVPGCTKFKKDGSPCMLKGKVSGYREAGAKTLLEQHPDDWRSLLLPEELERNRTLVVLPAPHWDLEVAENCLQKCATRYERTDEFWDKYFVTETLRKTLGDRTERDAWVTKLRLHFLEKGKSPEESE